MEFVSIRFPEILKNEIEMDLGRISFIVLTGFEFTTTILFFLSQVRKN